ncbi:MAG: type IV secretion system DNA-binding domain-containing protein [Gammaproteobacteria bacterium]|nr:type IV secretion system DNA-binding domain-containing protein [Gammaproteobacteria bacterium]
MARDKGGLISTFTRGGQTTIHRVTMAAQVMWTICTALVFIIALCAITWVWQNTTDYERYLWVSYHKAAFKVDSDPYGQMRFKYPDGTKINARIINIVNAPDVLRAKERVGTMVSTAIDVSLWSGIAIFIIGPIYFYRTGREIREDRDIRGIDLTDRLSLVKAIDTFNKKKGYKEAYRLAGVPYPWNSETQGTLVCGTPGSGKTVAISELVEQIRERDGKAIIYDKMRAFIPKFYREEGDVILNPLDDRTPSWSVFAEARSHADFTNIAAALIPPQKGAIDPFFIDAARIIFTEMAFKLHKEGKRSNKELIRNLLLVSFEEMIDMVKGTMAAQLISEKGPKMAQSIISMLVTNLSSTRYLRDDRNIFSIRNWIENDQKNGILWISSRGNIHNVVKPLISVWMDISVNTLLSMEQSSDRKFWVILDELPSLHQLPSVASGLAETRQFGGSFLIGYQLYSQLEDVYGHTGAVSIAGLCKRRLIFTSHDERTAEWGSQALGKKEIEEANESISYGAHAIRDGVAISTKSVIKPLVSPSEIMDAPDLTGWLRTGGGFPITKVSLEYKERSVIAQSMVERDLEASDEFGDITKVPVSNILGLNEEVPYFHFTEKCPPSFRKKGDPRTPQADMLTQNTTPIAEAGHGQLPLQTADGEFQSTPPELSGLEGYDQYPESMEGSDESISDNTSATSDVPLF